MPPSDASVEAVDLATLPLYNTSFTLYRCSPLHLSRNASEDDFRKAFSSHTRRFADHLQREARLGLSILEALDDSDALARAGPLKQTSWTWEATDDKALPEGPDGLGLTEGLQIVVEFERATYTALFLRRRGDIEEDADVETEHRRLRLPLLFFRMPTTLRGALLSYIAAHFDARADPVHIPGLRLAKALEDYLATIAPEIQRDTAEGDDSDDDTSSSIVKDVQLTLSFPSPALRSLDVAVPGKDVARFIKVGIQTAPATNGSRRAVHANATTKEARGELDAGPFTRALAAYLSTHLALNAEHRDVHLARIACAGWALGREGRVKIFAPSRNVQRDEGRAIVERLLEQVLDWKGLEEDMGGDGDVVMKG